MLFQRLFLKMGQGVLYACLEGALTQFVILQDPAYFGYIINVSGKVLKCSVKWDRHTVHL